MYNQKILKYKYKLGTSNDLRKKNLYKYKLAHYNQLGGMDLVKKPCNCGDGYVSAAAGDAPPCRCVPTVRLEQSGDDALRREVSDVHKIFESPLLSYMTAFRDDAHNLPTEINFQCSKDPSECFHYQSKDWSMFFDPRLDHTKCFYKKYIKEYQFHYRVNKLVIGSLIDLNVLLKSSIFNNLIELELLSHSDIKEIPNEVCSILQSLQSLNIDKCPIKQLPSLRELKKLSCIDCNDLTELPKLPKLEILNSLRCKGLSEISEFPELIHLDISFANVKNLHSLSKLTKLSCNSCYGLNKLPELPELEELECSSCRDLSGLPNLPKLLKLECAYIPNLNKLPDNLLDLEMIDCRRTGLINIPQYPKLKYLDCRECEGLTGISEYPELINLNISSTNVEILPLYPKLKTLIANNCLNLYKLESLPLLETLLIQNCVNLKVLPLLMNLRELLCNGSGFAMSESNKINYKHIMPKLKAFYGF